MTKITLEFLKTNKACQEGIDWFSFQSDDDPVIIVQKLISEKKFRWANWLITRLFDKISAVKYAVFAARSVLDIYEKKYPEDQRPRKAIETAENYLNDPSNDNADAVAASSAASSAAYAAYAAENAANAANAAANAAAHAAHAAYDAGEMFIKILNFGLNLIKED